MPDNSVHLMRNKRSSVLLAALFLMLGACVDRGDRPVFRLLSPSETGISFANIVTTTDSLNEHTDPYTYNGAGVAVGDIDNDGLPDVFFSGNMVSSRLYRNKGGMRFEDITQKAGVTTKQWATGVTMVDINGDGYLDIYVSVSGHEWSSGSSRANLLFVNNGNGTFTEAAAQYGIADTSFTTHAVFLDYNRDGCLDLFLLNNSPKDFSRGDASHPVGVVGVKPGTYNALYRNDCVGGKPAKFTEVSREAGILKDPGYGLGVVVADLNRDGWPDIYVSNDALPNDVMYINNRDGTFTNKAPTWLKHASYAGMGLDIADFNNDGWPDIMQADMMPRDLERRKRTIGLATYGSQLDARRQGYRDDYSENSLQLSNGLTREGDIIFSDVARLAGVSHTDWSWSVLFADFDNDGYKDIFVGNGYPKAVNDLDYMTAMNLARQRGDKARMRRLLADLPSYAVSNYVFRNNGDLTFSDKSKSWGIDQPGFSYGAAYADFNNDGRLDLVVNNIDSPASIYENIAPIDEKHHYLDVRLIGEAPRELTAGIGGQVILAAGGQKQYVYLTPYRGFMSSVDPRAHFGLGELQRADSLEIEWPDGRYQLLTNVTADRLLTVRQSDAAARNHSTLPAAVTSVAADRWFEPVNIRGLAYKQTPGAAADFSVQPLLPYLISRHGPPIAVADVNGDGLDDLFVGGDVTAGVVGKLFLQRKGGSFVESAQGQPWEADRNFEDWGAAFLDVNADGRPDLYVSSGSYAAAPGSAVLQDRLYVNQGNGRFVRDARALPPMIASKGTVRVGDFNGDGKPDLFVAGRLMPRKYPYPTRSYVLRNDGGHFTDVTPEVAPDLAKPGGMVTDAAWVDFDGDGRLDLVTVGEWMSVEFFRNEGTRFRNVTSSTSLPPSRGWWYSLAVGDFDNDGRPDLVAGNLGLNGPYMTSRDTTLGVYASNFTGNQTTDVILTQKVNGKEYSLAGTASLGRSIYPLSIQFPTYGSYAVAPIGLAFSSSRLQQALHYEADTFASCYLHNDGGGKFSERPLPNLAQVSPIKSIAATDVDLDGHLDLIVAGNLDDAGPNTAAGDAGNGLWLKGDGHGHFSAISPRESGFLARRNVSGLALLRTESGVAVVISNSDESIEVFRIAKR